MATHAAAPVVSLTRRRSSRPPRGGIPTRIVMVFVVALFLGACIAWPTHARRAATAACTFGSPENATCGEALVLLGYP